MRICLDDSSSASSSIDGDISEPSRINGRESSATPKAAAGERPSLIKQSSSSSSLLDDDTPQRRRRSHLERASEAKKLSLSSRARVASRGSTPVWMNLRKVSNVTGNDSGDSEEDRDGSDNDAVSDSDSEEDEWPVAPSNLRPRARKEERRSAKLNYFRSQEVAAKIRLSGLDEVDPDQQQIAPRRVRLQSPPLVIDSPTRQRLHQERKAKASAEFDQIQTLLKNLRIKKENEEAVERRQFEERNRTLWEDIEAGIRQVDLMREKVAKEEQERLQRAREQREAAERRAQEVKAAEQARLQVEKAEEEKRIQEEQERQRAEAQAEEERAREEKANNITGVGSALDREARQAFDAWWVKMNHIKTNVLPVVSKNAGWRKQCFTAKKSITRGVSQLTNSRTEIVRITQSINDVLTQAKMAVATGEIYTWILNHLSKCLIRQAEQEVAAKQGSCFPLARVVSWLLLEGHSELGDVLMARLTKKCCWCLPHCPARKEGQDETAYAKLFGKANIEEATFAYTTRMTGIIAFYFAICQTKPSAPPSSTSLDVKKIPEHFRISALWTWMARAMSPRILNQPVSPALWSALIEVAGPVLVATYGKQTNKLWNLMLLEGINGEKAGFVKVQAASSGKVRLKQLLEDYRKTGQVQESTGGRQMEA